LETPAGDPFAGEGQSELIEQLPKVWIGYLLALATFAGEAIAVSRHPELAKGAGLLVPPPLEIYLPAFVALVYWLVCVHRYHVVMSKIPGWKHPITPNKAVWFHFIPLFNLYWVFKWPEAIASFVNQRVGRTEMKGWIVGVGFLASALCRLVLDAALGLGILFYTCTYISGHLKRALGAGAPLSQ
jgi:hypothetical protein